MRVTAPGGAVLLFASMEVVFGLGFPVGLGENGETELGARFGRQRDTYLGVPLARDKDCPESGAFIYCGRPARS